MKDSLLVNYLDSLMVQEMDMSMDYEMDMSMDSVTVNLKVDLLDFGKEHW